MVDLTYLMSAPEADIVVFLAGWIAGIFCAGLLALVVRP